MRVVVTSYSGFCWVQLHSPRGGRMRLVVLSGTRRCSQAAVVLTAAWLVLADKVWQSHAIVAHSAGGVGVRSVTPLPGNQKTLSC